MALTRHGPILSDVGAFHEAAGHVPTQSRPPRCGLAYGGHASRVRVRPGQCRSQNEPEQLRPAETSRSGKKDRLGSHDRDLLIKAKRDGRSTVKAMFAVEPSQYDAARGGRGRRWQGVVTADPQFEKAWQTFTAPASGEFRFSWFYEYSTSGDNEFNGDVNRDGDIFRPVASALPRQRPRDLGGHRQRRFFRR